MDAEPSHPGSPAGGPLQNLSPDKVNQQQTQGGHKRSDSRSKDNSSSVHDKVSQFNNLSVSSAGRSMERKTADAALKRAMLGREEAEAETRRLRDEIKALNKTLEEGKDRERKVGERLEAVMENYGRAKETHAHTQTLWEKEIRRARKETFKSQSGAVKLQEELKAARVSAKSLEEHIKREKERSRVREQEAFEARYQIVGVQEQLDQALERIKTVEQERDAFKTAAQNEEVARIAAEGRIPLPQTQLGDEFASPPKKRISSGLKKRKINDNGGRMSLSMLEIESSAASEMEIEELTQQVLWEKNRAERAEELVEFLQAECKMRICSCGKTRKTVTVSTQSEPEEPVRRPVVEESEDHDAHDDVDDYIEPPVLRMEPEFQHKTTTPDTSMDASEHHSGDESMRPSEAPRSKKGPRHSTIFCPKEGVFRTVTEQEAMILASQKEAEIVAHRDDTVERHELKAESEQQNEEEYEQPQDHDESQDHLQEHEYEHELEHQERYGQDYIRELELELEQEPPSPVDELARNPRMFARTPSADPPTFALLEKQRASLMSLLNAPHNDVHSNPLPSSFSVPVVEAADYPQGSHRHSQRSSYQDDEYERHRDRDRDSLRHASLESRPQSSATLYSVTTTTTSVPIHSEDRKSSSSFHEKLRTPSTGSSASFDTKNPALTPTMTREQALAKIRERRGRARSAAQGPPSGARKPTSGGPSRIMSAPTGKPSSRMGKSRS